MAGRERERRRGEIDPSFTGSIRVKADRLRPVSRCQLSPRNVSPGGYLPVIIRPPETLYP